MRRPRPSTRLVGGGIFRIDREIGSPSVASSGAKRTVRAEVPEGAENPIVRRWGLRLELRKRRAAVRTYGYGEFFLVRSPSGEMRGSGLTPPEIQSEDGEDREIVASCIL